MTYEDEYLAAQERALEARQKKQFSRVGMVAASFLLVTYAAQFGLVIFVELLNRILGGAVDLFSNTGIILMSAVPMYLVAFPVAAALMLLVPRCGRPQRESWGADRFLACLVISIGLGLAGNLLSMLVEQLKPSAPSSDELDALLLNTSVWVNVLVTVLLAPVVEELFYRKLLMDRLLGYGDLPAILMSGLMFGLAHGNFSQFFYAFGIGIVWAYMYAKTGKVGYTIALHMIFNLLGGVITIELIKAGSGNLDAFWFLSPFVEQLPAAFSQVIAVLSGMLVTGNFILMAGCLIGGITLIIVFRRQICFAPGQWPIKRGNRFKIMLLNGGMLLYLIVCMVMFILNW